MKITEKDMKSEKTSKKKPRKKGLLKLVGQYLDYRETCCDISSVRGGQHVDQKTTIREAKEYECNKK